MRNARSRSGDERSGFSMIELVVVIGIIGALAAISLPAIGRYFRLYKVRGAQSQVAGDLQAARNKAISKNVNFGVDFIVQNATTYWVHVEDDQSDPRDPSRQLLNFASPSNVQSVRGTLPGGIQFATTTAQCPNTPAGTGLLAAPGIGYLQYERLGNLCTGSGCPAATPANPTAALSAIDTSGTTSLVCVYQVGTTLHRLIEITPGGRVVAKQ